MLTGLIKLEVPFYLTQPGRANPTLCDNDVWSEKVILTETPIDTA